MACVCVAKGAWHMGGWHMRVSINEARVGTHGHARVCVLFYVGCGGRVWRGGRGLLRSRACVGSCICRVGDGLLRNLCK